MSKPIIILGIESSCDDTSASVLKDGVVLSNIISSQTVHKKYGGVVPELASRAHQQNIIPVVDQAIKEANIDKKQISHSIYQRPWIIRFLLVGVSFAKSLGLGLSVPLLINHMQAMFCSFY